MADRSKIEWCEASWNPIRARHRVTGKVGWACVKVSPGCTHCYAERLNKLRGTGEGYTVSTLKDDVELFLDEQTLIQPLRWRRPRRIFVCSMTDLFAEQVPEEWIDQIFAVMTLAPDHIFQVLTKRPERMYSHSTGDASHRVAIAVVEMPESGYGAGLTAMSSRVAWGKGPRRYEPHEVSPWPLPNVWLGISAEDQPRLDERVIWLLKTPAAVRFLSLEPLLSGINLRPTGALGCDCHGDRCLGTCAFYRHAMDKSRRIDWIIVGGESGGPPERALVDRCLHCHGRELTRCSSSNPDPFSRGACDGSGWVPKPEALEWVRQIRDQCVAAGVPFFFKSWGGATFKSGGRLLDGRTWDEYPK